MKISVFKRLSVIFFFLCCLSATSSYAHTLTGKHELGDDEGQCIVVFPEEIRTRSTRKIPVISPKETTDEIIPNTGHVYVYRLALCITPEAFLYDFHSSKAEVSKWWEEMERYLERMYLRDVGIRFKVIRDDKLIMVKNTTNYTPRMPSGTKIIDELIGSSAYETGVLIGHKETGANGVAYMRGITSSDTKGMAWAIKAPSTIAHEIGHLLGACHTHHKADGNFTEPGLGQSLMGYGYPRRCLSLASIKTIRTILARTGYYGDSSRDASKIVYKSYNNNLPYIEMEKGGKPQLDTDRMRKSYTVTRGTYFQFYLPVKGSQDEELYYRVHPFDIVTDEMEPNSLQRVHEPNKNNYVMFQPYYEKPDFPYTKEPIPMRYTDAFRNGVYRFLAAASSYSHYDSREVKLHIVDGKPFRIDKFTGKENNTWGENFTLTWNPCTELYGEHSKVRILLSTDFGQTFPYILADDVANHGSWQGSWPHIYLGTTSYKDLPEQIKGGVIKIEVKGEAAYDIYPRVPYMYEGQNVIYTGGFTIDNLQAKITFDNAPEPFVTLKDRSQLPKMTKLKAKHKWGNSNEFEGKEQVEGCIIRRTWTASINGDVCTYTQVFRLPEVETSNYVSINEAKDLSEMAFELYNNGGKLGYPKNDCSEYQAFRMAYAQVYEDNRKVKDNVGNEEIRQLKETLQALSQIGNEDIAKPETSRYYRLRNYQDIFGRPRYWYVGRNQYDEFLTQRADSATSWLLEQTGNGYKIKDGKGNSVVLGDFNFLYGPVKLERGYSWGAFTLVNTKQKAVQVNQAGTAIWVIDEYMNNPISYRVNNNGLPISTDFQWVPAEDKTSTSIQTINQKTSEPSAIYDLTGRKHRQIGKGVYIIKLDDGTVKKIRR